MKKLFVGLAFALLAWGAQAQDALVVTTCGTLPTPYAVGSSQLPTVDVNGKLCLSVSSATNVTAAAVLTTNRLVVGDDGARGVKTADTTITGAYTFSGVVTAAAPVFTIPTLGVAAGTSLALNGATIGTNALAVTGTSAFSSDILLNSAGGFYVFASGGTGNRDAAVGHNLGNGNAGVGLASTSQIGWSSTADAGLGTAGTDVRITRLSAGVVQIGTNAANAAGALSAANMSLSGYLQSNNVILAAAAPTVAAAQIGYGSTTAAAANCNVAVPTPTACIVVNVAGTTRFIPYY